MLRFAAQSFGDAAIAVEPASADASFRSYWRIASAGRTAIVMDAPPDKESLEAWLDIGERLRGAGLHTPAIAAVDHVQGFIAMEDLGTRAYLAELDELSADRLYGDALDALMRMQTRVDTRSLPLFDDAFVRMELELLPQWLFGRHLDFAMSTRERSDLDAAFDVLAATIRAQPQCFMHRDYHSRNLMICTDDAVDAAPGLLPNPGIIDFQGAVVGPLTYDAASLLRDCYIAWAPARVDAWLGAYRQRLAQARVPGAQVDAATFRRWFDLTGLQRHLKVLGIFCRLWYRDGKAQYLDDLPLVWRHVIEVTRAHRDLGALADLLERARGGRDLTLPRHQESAP